MFANFLRFIVFNYRGVELNFIEAARKHMEPILRSLRPEDFLRKGNHSEVGPITLEKLLTNITNHIPHHVKFIVTGEPAQFN